jgi:hypothetical protein
MPRNQISKRYVARCRTTFQVVMRYLGFWLMAEQRDWCGAHASERRATMSVGYALTSLLNSTIFPQPGRLFKCGFAVLPASGGGSRESRSRGADPQISWFSVCTFVVTHSVGIMARWPRRTWTTLFTYGAIFLMFPILAFLAYAFVNGWFP